MRQIAFFDLDDTLVKGDTFFEFLSYTHGRRKWINWIFVGPVITVLYALGKRQQAKEFMLSTFYKGWTRERLGELGASFALYRIEEMVNQEVMEDLEALKNSGVEIFIVSASLDFWIEPWTSQKGYTLIASKAAFQNNRFTGKLDGVNCSGPEKVNRIKAEINLNEVDIVAGYGNHPKDAPMVELATKKVYI